MKSVLDKKLYPFKDFKYLYHLRWGIEENYKLMKSHLVVESFSGVSDEVVLQDALAEVLTESFAAVAIIEADIIKSICIESIDMK